MDFLTTAIYFGIAAALVMFLFNIFHCVLAGIFGVRVEKFGMLMSISNAAFLKFKRNHTEFALGFIPTGSFVKISGMHDENLDDEPVKIEAYMLSSKSPIVRFICMAGTPFLLFILFIICANFIDSNNSLTADFNVLNDVIYNIYQYVIGGIDIAQTATNWHAIAVAYNEFPIILCLMTLFTAFTSITTLLSNTISQKIPSLQIALHVVTLIFYLFICYKIVVLYFSLYGFTDGLLTLLKFAVMVYILSLILMLLIKILPKNKFI